MPNDLINTPWQDDDEGSQGGGSQLTPVQPILNAQKEEEEGGTGGGIGELSPEEIVRLAAIRRQLEQAGHRRYARVNVRFKPESVPSQGYGPRQTLKQHPWLITQRFDGIDKSLSADPRYHPDAAREFENEMREQEKEKQLRLGNAPGRRFDPRPSPG